MDKVLYEWIEYKQQSLDVAIVLGSSKAHIYRLLYAVEVYKNGLVSKIIVSGGRNIGNANMVEADYLKEKAIEFGIKKKDILVENKAMTTWENMKLSRELMIKNNLLGECTNIAIVTSSFHMRRSIMIAERVFRDDGVNIVSLPGEDNSTRRTTWFTNEKGRVRAIGEVEKIIDYVKKGKLTILKFPFSMVNKENTKKRKKKAFKGGKSLNENNSNCSCDSRRKNNYS